MYRLRGYGRPVVGLTMQDQAARAEYKAVDLSLASPPALPDATEAMAEAFAWVLSGDTPQPRATALRLARRWLSGGER